MYDIRSISTGSCDRQREKASASAPCVRLTYTEVYAIASTARSKLQREADSLEQNLRRMVAHANLLDSLEDLRILKPRLEDDSEQTEVSDGNLADIEDDGDNGSISDDDEFPCSEADNAELKLVRWPSQLLLVPKPGSKHVSRSNQRPVEMPISQPVQQHTIAALLDRLEEDLSGESSDDETVAAEEPPPWNGPGPGNGSLTLAMLPAAGEVDLAHPLDLFEAQSQLAVPVA